MKLTFINQSQPNIRYIINDSSEEFNFPDFDFENRSLYYKKNEYENRLYKIENHKLSEIFQTNHQKFTSIIFLDPYKNIVKQFDFNINYLVTPNDINISSYVLLNETNLSLIFDYTIINQFSDIEYYNKKINDHINKIKKSNFNHLNKIKNLLNIRNLLDLNQIDEKINHLQWMINELLADCTVKFTFFDQFSNSYVNINSIFFNDEEFNCEYNNNICYFTVPTYKLLKNDINFKINTDNYFSVSKFFNKFKYNYIISMNHIIDFGKLFSSKQMYQGIDYWVEMDYNAFYESDLDLHCYEFNENKELINHCFWRNKGNEITDLQLVR